MLTSIFTAALTVFGGYFLYQRQQIWNEKRKHYEFILTELEYMAEAGQQIMESCDQEIYLMSCSMEEDEKFDKIEYDIADLKNKMYKRIYKIKSKMPIMELYITDHAAEFVLKTIGKMKKDLMMMDHTINQTMKLIVDTGWTPSVEEFEHQQKVLTEKIIDLRFSIHAVIKDEMKKTNTIWDKIMKWIGV